ncbi:MAG TPA: hypothetical protein VK745_18430 [Polyangiaceae bacterium]|nr:hypothetical protein [Polyangiaceae bacterium]
MQTPDERALRADLARAPFLMGEADGRWKLVEILWPHVFVTVKARDHHDYCFRFECSGYPETLPTGAPWDLVTKNWLSAGAWPQSRGGRVSTVFRSGWQGGTALYLPCDRTSIAGHDNWRTELPSKIWRPKEGLVQYLELVHDLLNCSDYTSPAVTAA